MNDHDRVKRGFLNVIIAMCSAVKTSMASHSVHRSIDSIPLSRAGQNSQVLLMYSVQLYDLMIPLVFYDNTPYVM